MGSGPPRLFRLFEPKRPNGQMRVAQPKKACLVATPSDPCSSRYCGAVTTGGSVLGAVFAENFNVKEAMVDSSLVLFLSFIDDQPPSLPKNSVFFFLVEHNPSYQLCFKRAFTLPIATKNSI